MNINPAQTANLDLKNGITIGHDSSNMQVPSTEPATGTVCTSGESAAKHTQRIAECEYFAAEKRNFAGGDPLQDWLIA